MSVRPAVTELLGAVAQGEKGAQDQLYGLVYDELKRIARGTLRKVGGSSTINPSTLVHEAYLKLSADADRELSDSNHFYSLLARAMRQVILDAGRARAAVKHGHGYQQVDLSDAMPMGDQSIDNLLGIDQALRQLESLDPELADLVELHFFGGLAFVDIARLRGQNERTVRRHWDTARAFLLEHMPNQA
jgi:RNA polymerase sigma factor (TIGR02999 family)